MIIKRLSKISILLIISFYPNLINSQYDYSYSADDEDFLPKLSDYNGSGGGGKNLPNYYDTDNYGDQFAPIDEEVVGGNDDSDYNGSGDYNDQYENTENDKKKDDYDPYGFSSNNNDEVITSYDSSSPVVPNEKEIDTKQEVDEVIEPEDNLIEEPDDNQVDQNEDYYDSNNYEDLPIDPVNQPDDDDNIETLDQFDENNFYEEDNDNTDENIINETNFTDNYDDDDNFEILDNDAFETPDYKDGPKIIEITESDKNIGPVVKQTTINDDSSNDKDLSNGGFDNNPVVKFFKDIFNFQFEGDFWSEKYFLAALLCGAFVGFLIIAIVIGFICHSIRKADEGSYIIDKTLRYNEEYTRDSLLQNAINSNNKFQVNPSQTMGNQEYFA